MENEGLNFNEESFSNLVGFFDLLIKVDQRINPDLYRENSSLEKGRDGNERQLK